LRDPADSGVETTRGQVNEHPIHLLLSDDLKRSRLTVFFRLLLALPHMVWLSLW
jgi:hypothetical protein